MTFSVEHNFDETVITVLDDTAELEDVKIFFTDDGVDIIQVTYMEELEIYNCISLSHEMLEDVLAAYNSPEGVHRRVVKEQ